VSRVPRALLKHQVLSPATLHAERSLVPSLLNELFTVAGLPKTPVCPRTFMVNGPLNRMPARARGNHARAEYLLSVVGWPGRISSRVRSGLSVVPCSTNRRNSATLN